MSTQDQGTKRKAEDEAATEYTDPSVTSATNGAAPAPKRAKITADTASTNGRPVAMPKSRSHKTKALAVANDPDQAAAAQVPPAITAAAPVAPVQSRPINEQDLFILHTRANLVPGSAGPKEWTVVTNEFNTQFSAVLKKPLASKTVSKRGQVAKKSYMETNPGWAATLQYPVPHAAVENEQDEDEGDQMDMDDKAPEHEDMPTSDLASAPQQPVVGTEAPETSPAVEEIAQEDIPSIKPASARQEEILDNEIPEVYLVQEEFSHENKPVQTPASTSTKDFMDATAPETSVAQNHGTLQQIIGSIQPLIKDNVSLPVTAATDMLPLKTAHILEAAEEDISSQTPIPVTETLPAPVTTIQSTVCIADTSAADRISPISRAKFHLSRRTDDAVAFVFKDHGENYLEQENSQHFSSEHPESPVQVPKNITRKTVNAFIQLISPVRGSTLPTHYLWHSAKPVAGVYDRFAAIVSEKITWTADALHDLYAFARHMEVFFICDMVIDRLHTMSTEQKTLRDAYATMTFGQNGWIHVNGKWAQVGQKLPYVSTLEFSLAASDFETEHLDRLIAEPVDVPAVTFIADLLQALGGEADEESLGTAPGVVRNIFVEAGKLQTSSRLVGADRGQFCERYHHHGDGEECYTAFQTYTDEHFIDELYTPPPHEDIVKLSVGLPPAYSMESILYSDTGDLGELNEDNSSSEILEAEKEVMEMEMALEEAKKALASARKARKGRKTGYVEKARAFTKRYRPSK